MGRPAKLSAIPTRSVRLLDGPPKKSLADLGGKAAPPEPDEPDRRTAKRIVKGIKIEDHIPLPSKNGGRSSLYSEAMGAMDVGDSFLMSGIKTGGAIYAAKKNHPGKKFACRPVSGGMRVWRVE